MKIYTRTGDAGDTGLFGGPRVAKDNPRIAAYGDIDELNAAIGVARAEALPAEIDALLGTIQNHLFDVGAELATPDPAKHGTAIIGPPQVLWQEQAIDRFEAQLAPLRQFILPGGVRGAALLHLARCTCRRAERSVVTLSHDVELSPSLLQYVNRLSDLLFVLARASNMAVGSADVPWQKGS